MTQFCSFLWLSNIPLRMYVCVCVHTRLYIYHIFVHSSVDVHFILLLEGYFYWVENSRKWNVFVAQSCLTLCNIMGCSLPGSYVHGIFQARILEWVVISFSRGSSQPRARTSFSGVSCIGRQILYHWATREPQQSFLFLWRLLGFFLCLLFSTVALWYNQIRFFLFTLLGLFEFVDCCLLLLLTFPARISFILAFAHSFSSLSGISVKLIIRGSHCKFVLTFS